MLDRRLLPLIETLTRSDLDWLALEVINGALAGRAPNEPSEAIIAARSVAFRQKQDAGLQEFTSATEQPGQPFSWQEQIEWAVKHVLERISQVISMMSASAERLNAIVEEGADVIERPKTILVLAEADASSKVSVEELTAAAEAFASLQGLFESGQTRCVVELRNDTRSGDGAGQHCGKRRYSSQCEGRRSRIRTLHHDRYSDGAETTRLHRMGAKVRWQPHCSGGQRPSLRAARRGAHGCSRCSAGQK